MDLTDAVQGMASGEPLSEVLERRMAAVLAADVVDYSRLMAEDEVGTHARVKAHLSQVIEPVVARHGGRIVRLMGDGLLVEFGRVEPALSAALAIQQETARHNAALPRHRRIAFRIGLNWGEVIVDAPEVYGHGVNVAARLEALADPGGIFISDEARAELPSHAVPRLADLGPQMLKNIAEPVRVLRVLVDAHGPGLNEAAAPAFKSPAAGRSIPPCPYRGLYAFREEDASFFFGRDAASAELEQAVRSRPLTAVLGPSGSGKSSAVFAGVIPRLRSDGEWRVIAFRPGQEPLHNLSAALLQALRPALPDEDRRVVLDRIAAGNGDLPEGWRDLLADRPPNARLLVIADQFEQTYTLARDPAGRERFLTALLEISRTPSCAVLLTLRADFLGKALASRAFADALKGADVKLGPMTEDELRAAIENPARTLGVRFEMGLVDRILNDVQGQPGHLPLLEFALTELWSRQRQGRLTHMGYEDIGGVREAIASYAESVFRELAPDEQTRVREVFLRLVRPGEGTEDTRRVASRAEIQDDRWDAVDRLASARLVITRHDDSSGQDTAEVVHEALIREWRRLRGWVDHDREFLVWRQRLGDARRQWEQGGRTQGYLLREAPLAQAREWLDRRGGEIGIADRAFILASQARLAREEAAARRRRRLTMAGLAAVAALFFTLFIGAGALWFEADDQRQAAQVTQSRFWADQSSQQLEDGDAATAVLLALEALPRDLEDPERPYVAEAEAQLYRALAAARASRTLQDQGPAIWDVALAPDGQTFALAGEGGAIQVWRLDQGGAAFERTLEGHEGAVRALAFSPDGAVLASAANDGTARLWGAGGAPPRVLEGHAGPVVALAFSPDGTRLATASWDRTARIWEVATGRLVGAPLGEHTAVLTAIAYDPGGRHLVTASLDGTAIIRDAAQGRPVLPPLEGQGGPIWQLAFSPDGERLLTAAEGLTVDGDDLGVEPTKQINTGWLWDVASGERLISLEGHRGGILAAAFSPPTRLDPAGGAMLVTGSRDRSARLWNSRTGRQLAVFEGHQEPLTAISYSADGERIATGARDGTVRVFDPQSYRQIGPPQRHGAAISALLYLPDGRRVVSAAEDGSVHLAEVEPGRQEAVFTGHAGPVAYVSFLAPETSGAPAPPLALSTSRDNTVWGEQVEGDRTARLFDVRAGREVAVLQHESGVRWADATDDGRTIVTGTEDGTVTVWRLAADLSASVVGRLDGHAGAIRHVEFDPDGRRVLTASADGTARVFDLATGTAQVLVPEAIGRHPEPLYVARFSPDGTRIVTGVVDGTSWLWREAGATGFELVSQLDRADVAILAIEFSPDGTRVVTALESPRGTVTVWDAVTGAPVHVLEGHVGPVMGAVFSPDGRWIATSGEDQTARLWDARTLELRSVMEGHLAGVNTVAFVPGARRPRIVTGSWDGHVRLFDGLSGELLQAFRGHRLGIPKVDVSADGILIASASWDMTARVWRIMDEGQALVGAAQGFAQANGLTLSPAQAQAFHVVESSP